MSNYLIFCRNDKDETIAAWVDVPSEYTGDQYGDLQEQFVKDHGKTAPTLYDKYADMVRIMSHDREVHDIPFDWELAGPHGASFRIFHLPEFTDEQVKQAEENIRRDRDCVRMNIIKVKEMVEVKI